nr:isoprenylcysteine carboxylmethyltransferase family protein [Sulfitobacter sp. S190]
MFDLVWGVVRAPKFNGRFALALVYGVACHALFALAVGAMIVAMFFGMSESFGRVPQPWAWAANLLLIVQFPVVHSLLLSPKGRWVLGLLAPERHARTLGTTTFALVASVQLLALFTLWTPSGIVWWRAEGAAFWVVTAAYAGSYLLLMWASFDAGAEVQSGALGWMSMAQGRKPEFPGMPTRGLFRYIRQPIYLSFALTLWTVPVWTPDQLMLALILSAYCVMAPHRKERRFAKMYGAQFEAYRDRVPYMVPHRRPRGPDGQT